MATDVTTSNGLNADLARTLIRNYTNNHLAVINASTQLTALRQPNATSDSRCIWFSIDDLKSFMSDIESAYESKCSAMTGALGIRFYYCEYPAAGSSAWGTTLPMSEAQYAGMHTVMMVPTYNNGSKNVDFDPNYATPEGIPIPLTTVYSTIEPATTNLLMKNHGALVPPPFTGATLGPLTGAYMLDIAGAPGNP